MDFENDSRNRKRRGPSEAGDPDALQMLRAWAAEHKDGRVESVPDDDHFRTTYPKLWAFLTWTTVDGLRKEPARLSFTTDGSVWRATFLDQTTRRTFSVTSATFLDALGRLEACVVAKDTVWSMVGRRSRGWREAPQDARK